MPKLGAAPVADKPPRRTRAAAPPPEPTEESGDLFGSSEPDEAADLAELKAKAAKGKTKAGQTDEWGFQPLADADDYLNVLYYGREGSGKTTNMAAVANVAPEGSRVLVINAESGLKNRALQKRGIDTSKIVFWPNRQLGQEITYASLEALHEKLLGDLQDDPNSWYAVGLDSITDTHQGLREQATEKRIDKQLAKAGSGDVDEDFVDRDDFGVMTNQMRKLIRRFRDLPCHVIFTALERVDDTTKMIGPAVTPALGTDLMGYVDYILYCKATQHAPGEDADDTVAEFRALTRAGAVTRAKDRLDATPRAFANPTFDRLLAYDRGELDEATDPVQAAYRERRAQEEAIKAAKEAEKQAAKEARQPAKKAAPRKAAAAPAE